MGRKTKRILLAIALTIVAAGGVRISGLTAATRALREYFRPTVVKMMPLPKGCTPTDETPPANLMRIVEYQRNFYHLEMQKVIVCRTNNVLPQGGPEFLKEVFGDEIRKRWLPLYVGCCSYQFRRHVVVVIASADLNGSVVVEAALIQSRWEYLRSNWAKDRSYWY